MRFWDDQVRTQVDAVLAELEAGRPPAEIEHRLVDVKEEPGRRGAGGVIVAGTVENEDAATYFCGEVACMATSPNGGALIIGVGNRGELIGTELNGEWLRHRLWEKLQRQVTVEVVETAVRGARVLILFVPAALEPVSWNGRLRWRVDDNCVELDAASWWEQRNRRMGHDWAAEPSNFTLDDVRPAAIDLARRYLHASGEDQARDLAAASDLDLLRRLNAVVDGQLTRAAAILFVGTGRHAIDYLRSDTPGHGSQIRLREDGLSVLEELAAVEQAIAASNKVIHGGTETFARGQLHELPPLAVREAIVNGVAHRDWRTEEPVTVEHVGPTLVVSSPGGFVAGVNAGNILTHPSAPRYRSLAELFAALRVAEREGVGVDRMYRDMVAAGYAPPVIEELGGPRVRVALVGGTPDEDWVRFLGAIDQVELVRNVNAVLVLDALTTTGWVDVAAAAPLLQRSPAEVSHVLGQLQGATIDGAVVAEAVDGAPGADVLRPSAATRRLLPQRASEVSRPDHRRQVALRYAQHRGRISTTELGSLVGINPGKTVPTLSELEAEGELEPSRPARRGRGFFYRPTDRTL